MAPVFDEVADEVAGRVRVAKLDTDRNRRITGRFSIRGVPTLIVFRDGEEVAPETGAVGGHRIDSLLAATRGTGDAA